MKAMRPQPEYFAVGYYGQGFPSFLRVRILQCSSSGVVDTPEVMALSELPRKCRCQTPFALTNTERSKSLKYLKAFQHVKRDSEKSRFLVLPALTVSCSRICEMVGMSLRGLEQNLSLCLGPVHLLRSMILAIRKCLACKEFILLLFILNQSHFQAMAHVNAHVKGTLKRGCLMQRIKMRRCFLLEMAAEHCWTCAGYNRRMQPKGVRWAGCGILENVPDY